MFPGIVDSLRISAVTREARKVAGWVVGGGCSRKQDLPTQQHIAHYALYTGPSAGISFIFLYEAFVLHKTLKLFKPLSSSPPPPTPMLRGICKVVTHNPA